MNIPVIYEDDWLLAVNKPQGLLTVPTSKNKPRPCAQGRGKSLTLTNLLNEKFARAGISYRLHPCHRLDRETSGLIIYAKGKSLQKRMMELFKLKKIRKKYIAFVHGRLSKDRGSIRHLIEGKDAFTEYRVIGQRKDFSITQVMPLTGRTNQIRIHFKLIGHPLVGEKKFAFRKDFKLRVNRLCLHAKTLEFIHPVTGERILLDSELPVGMKNFLQKHPQ